MNSRYILNELPIILIEAFETYRILFFYTYFSHELFFIHDYTYNEVLHSRLQLLLIHNETRLFRWSVTPDGYNNSQYANFVAEVRYRL